MSATAVAALQPRQRATVVGEIRAVVSYELPYPRTDAELDDETGVVVLRFLGRTEMPGFVPGRRLSAEGTPRAERHGLVIVNPRYSFEGEE